MKLTEGEFDPIPRAAKCPATLDVTVAIPLEDQYHAEVAADPTERESQTAGPLKIAGEQNIRTAAELLKTLIEHVGRGPALVVDLAGVQECDATLLQLLYSLRKTADRRKERFDILSVSPEVAAVAATLGLRLDALSGQPTGTRGC